MPADYNVEEVTILKLREIRATICHGNSRDVTMEAYRTEINQEKRKEAAKKAAFERKKQVDE